MLYLYNQQTYLKVWKFLLTCVSKLAAFYFKTITLFTGNNNIMTWQEKTEKYYETRQNLKPHLHVDLFLCLQSFWWHILTWHVPILYSIIFCDNPFNIAGLLTIWPNNGVIGELTLWWPFLLIGYNASGIFQ